MEQDERISEIRAAQQTLHDAIDTLNKLCGDEGFLMEWVVIECRHIAEDDGRTYTGQTVIVSENLPAYRKIGLLKTGSMMAKQEYLEATRPRGN